jgi:molybdopterin-binding protein
LDTAGETESNLAVFDTAEIRFAVQLFDDGPTLDSAASGFLFLRSEDVILSRDRPETSARNSFSGRITDLAPTTHGVEVTVDVGVEVTSLITENSLQRLGLELDKDIWVSFKATAGRFCAA